ncbi:hypothetical protein OF83DRAFT_17632 [Amylostereum chailletii]|nr:hypothetical protein OF83DRAFT_17632 [Amylostereum chailletii]
MHFFKACAALTTLFTLAVNAQQITTTDAFGFTIVDSLSFDPLQAITVTIPIQTITAASTTTPTVTPITTSTSTTTTSAAAPAADPGQQGPVGQPAATSNAEVGGPTPFTYTTTDAQGNVIQVEATFTPSFPQTQQPNPATTGTILAYSDWLGLVGTQTALSGGSGSTVANGASAQWKGATKMAVAIAAGIVGGVMPIL